MKHCHSLYRNYTLHKLCHLAVFVAASTSLMVVHFSSTGLNAVCQIVSWVCLSKFRIIKTKTVRRRSIEPHCMFHSRFIHSPVTAIDETSTRSDNRWTKHSLPVNVVVLRANILAHSFAQFGIFRGNASRNSQSEQRLCKFSRFLFRREFFATFL